MPLRFRRAVAVAALVCAAVAGALPHAAYALTAADTAALAGDDFDAKTAAIERLASDTDPRARCSMHCRAATRSRPATRTC